MRRAICFNRLFQHLLPVGKRRHRHAASCLRGLNAHRDRRSRAHRTAHALRVWNDVCANALLKQPPATEPRRPSAIDTLCLSVGRHDANSKTRERQYSKGRLHVELHLEKVTNACCHSETREINRLESREIGAECGV
jgi:hypothetical protein